MLDACESVVGERTFSMIGWSQAVERGSRFYVREGWSWCAAQGLRECRDLLKLRLGEPGNVG